MKILVSDYDGTLKSENKNYFVRKIDLKLNIKAIKKFRKAGNKFIINTGRRLKTIKQEIKKYKIPFDYIICNNGLVAFDNSFNLIYAKYIDDEITKELLNVFETQNIISQLILMDENGNNSNNNLIKIGIKTNNFEKLKYCLLKIKEQNENLNIYHNFLSNAFWIHKYTDKAIGLECLLKNINFEFQGDDIYTIGNSQNDLEMINKYNGYYIKNSSLEYNKINNNIQNVRTLVKNINN